MRQDNAPPELVLKATPPRLGKGLLARQSLRLDAPGYEDKAVIAVQAPAGFGKTSLLGQWRRESLARAAVVAWLTLDERDEPMRFVQGLMTASRLGSNRAAFGNGLAGTLLYEGDALDALTAWLAAVADLANEVMLFLDDAHTLPAATVRRPLAYLLLNAPPNLKVVLASRTRLELPVADMMARGEYATVTTPTLHFRLEDTMALLRARFGDDVDADACALLQERTEGWPLGLQLAISSIEKSQDLDAAIRAISGGRGDLQNYFVESLFARLTPEQAGFLTRIALVQAVTPALCAALTGNDDARAVLLHLCESTPIFVEVSGSDWLRIHPLAREFLLRRFERLPVAERRELSERASRWLAGQQMYEEAAQLALSAGQASLAYDLAERCMYELILRGQMGRVLEWLERLPETEVTRRPRLRLAAAWALALGGHHDKARGLVAHIYADPDADPEDRCESAAVCTAAALFSDRVDEAAALLADWSVRTPPRSTKLQCFLANQQAQICLYWGEPEQTRYLFLSAPHDSGIDGMESSRSFGDWLVGMSYLAEGQVRLAEGVLRTALAHAESVVGRRSQVAVMLATALASALWERDQPEGVAALLANRLDAIERLAAPEMVASAYVLRARWLALHGQEHRAYDLLDNLQSLGERRQMPRLCLVSLAEQMRMHALRHHGQTCAALSRRLDSMVPAEVRDGQGLLGSQLSIPYGIALAYHALAQRDPDAMLANLNRVAPLAERLRRHHDSIRIQLLRALALKRSGEDGRPLFMEANSLAEAYGLTRVVPDTHPELADWAPPAPAAVRHAPDAPAAARPTPLRVATSALLTAKESEILHLLVNNMSNKQIGLTLDVRDETIKWHLKNLFGKLGVGSRRHAVNQARLIGLLDDGL
jgi:LuxR family transcriptional regulator, maltose regulon positive regulatory protein